MSLTPLTTSRLVALTLALAAVGCEQPAPEGPEVDAFDGTDDLAQGLGVTCVTDQICSGDGTVFTSTLRVGSTATSRSELVQTFIPEVDGPPSRVSLVLRNLRPITGPTPPHLHVEIRETPSATAPETLVGSALFEGSVAIPASGSGVTHVPLEGSGTLLATRAYTMLIWTDAPTSGSVLVGVGALVESAYAAGAPFRRVLRRVTDQDPWSTSRLRPASEQDLAFTFAGAPGSPCAGQGECAAALRCLAGACRAQNTTPVSISPQTLELAVGNSHTFSASGGNAPYTWAIASGGGSMSGATYTAPATAGSATVRVTDAFGATSDAAITINPALELAPATATITAGGTQTFSASGGVPPYGYSVLSGGGSFSGAIFTAPGSAGTVTVRVTDALANTADAVVTVTQVAACETYATLNPYDKDPGALLSSGNRSYSGSTGNGVRATVGKSTGKWYWEVRIDAAGTTYGPVIGVATAAVPLYWSWDSALGYYSWYGRPAAGATAGSAIINGQPSRPNYGATYGTGDVVGVALDMDARTLTFHKNGVSQGAFPATLPAGTYYPHVSDPAGGAGQGFSGTLNFGATAFTHTPPAGFAALSTCDDPYWSRVTLLMHMDGTDGSTAFVDAKGKALTGANGAALSTTQKKFGTASFRTWWGPGTQGWVQTSNRDGAFDFTGDFTIEFWHYLVPAEAMVYGTFFDTGTQQTSIQFGSPSSNLILYSLAIPALGDATGRPHGMTANAWNHLAFTRSGTQAFMFVNGVRTAYATGASGSALASSATSSTARIGNYTMSPAYQPGGWMDELRVTKGIARYTESFTPPTTAFPNQ